MSGAQNHTWAVTRPTGQRLRVWLHRHPLLPLAVSAAIGIVIDSLAGEVGRPIDSPIRGAIWIGLSIGTLTLMVCRTGAVSQLATVVVFMPLAGCSHALHELSYRQAELLSLVGPVGQSSVLEGVIEAPVVLRRHPLAPWRDERGESPWQTQFELQLAQLRMGREMLPCRGRVLVIVDGDCNQRRPGDVVRLFGRISAFAGPTNPGEVDRRAVYQQRQLHARFVCDSADEVVWIDSRPSGWQHLLSYIGSIASSGREMLLSRMGESTGALAVALVLGQREFVDDSTRDLLLVTGTAHLLSVSGLHLAIVVAIAGWLATIARFPLPMKILWIVLICFLYTAITGLRPPVVRASILVGTLMFALWMKRPGQPVNTLSLAAMILMAINPQLLFNLGVQLSFLAVLTLVTCVARRDDGPAAVRDEIKREQRLRQMVDRNRPLIGRCLVACGHRLGQAAWFSGCVTAISTPLVWQHFHVVTPISMVTNVVLSPFLFIALASGVATVLLGFLFEPWTILPATFCDLAMQGMHRIIDTAASVPGGHHWLPAPPAWWVTSFYVVIAASMLLPRSRRSSLIRYGWISVWIAIAWWMATSQSRLTPGSMEAVFVDVGHGTCVILRFSDEDVWLYDCGRLGNDESSSRGIDSALWSMGVTRLRGIFLSHADADHFNALPGVLERFGVRAIYTPPDLFADAEPALMMAYQAVLREKIEVVEISRGSMIACGGHRMLALHPPCRRIVGSDNANSLVLRIDGGGESLILPGDLEPPGTDQLIRADRPGPGGVLMAPHHGSLSMDAAAVLQWSRPSVTIVSGGRRAGRPEVERMLAETGASVHVTSQVGAIRVVIDRSGQVDVRSWKEAPW